MRKLRCFIATALVAGSMAVCAGAADTANRNTLLETAVTHLQQQWQTGNHSAYDQTDAYYASISSLMPEENLYELYFSINASRHNHGIINMQTGKIIVPPEYDTVDVLASGKLLLAQYASENTSYFYYADINGTVTAVEAPVQGLYMGMPDDAHIFIGIFDKRPLTDVVYYQTPTTIQYDIPKLVLLDEDMNVIRDDIDGACGSIPLPTFHNGLMPIQTDSTLWYGSVKGAYGNGKYGLIDTTGKFVSANDFDGIQWNDTRIIGKRGNHFYLIAPDGRETALPDNLDQYSSWTTVEVDSAAEHGLSLVNYHYPRLDITRMDFAAQAVQLYRVLVPDGQAAPDETPYTDCDDENVRLAAALGIVTGYEGGTFRPYASITREEAATMLNRLYKVLGGTQTAESSERYTDDAQFGEWSRDSIYAMRELGIMKGEENNAFHPSSGYTGEQALVTMERLYNKLHQ